MKDKIILALAAIGFGLMFAPVAFVGPNPPAMPLWIMLGTYAGCVLFYLIDRLGGRE